MLAFLIAAGAGNRPSPVEAVSMRTDDPMDLETLLSMALERDAPVLIDVPIGHSTMPRAKLQSHMPSAPWSQPQEGLIPS